jgi:hypothetical protein
VEDSVLDIDFRATNHIRYSPYIPSIEFLRPDTSTTIDLRNHFKLITGDTVPEISGDTIQYEIASIDNENLVSVSIDGSLLSVEPDSLEGTSRIHLIASAGFTGRMETIVILNRDGVPPEIFMDITYMPDSVIVQSSEDGVIYLVPAGTDNRPPAIKYFSIQSLPVTANSPVTMSLDTIGPGVYWLFAADANENISLPAVLNITSETSIIIDENPTIYPNPASTFLHVDTGNAAEYNLEISNMNGQLILGEKKRGPKIQMDVSSLPEGFYIISVKSRQFVTVEKLIKL